MANLAICKVNSIAENATTGKFNAELLVLIVGEDLGDFSARSFTETVPDLSADALAASLKATMESTIKDVLEAHGVTFGVLDKVRVLVAEL